MYNGLYNLVTLPFEFSFVAGYVILKELYNKFILGSWFFIVFFFRQFYHFVVWLLQVPLVIFDNWYNGLMLVGTHYDDFMLNHWSEYIMV